MANDRAGTRSSVARSMEHFQNPIYIGEIRHKGVRHPGLHEPIVDRELWDSTQLLLRSRAARRAPRAMKSAGSPLTGRLFDESGQSSANASPPKISTVRISPIKSPSRDHSSDPLLQWNRNPPSAIGLPRTTISKNRRSKR
jgi:hypothetical protein